MSARSNAALARSVHDRLLKLAASRKEDFNALLAELDLFCEALIAIRREIQEVLDGRMDRNDNPLKNAPHTAMAVTAHDWPHPYSRRQAAYPALWLEQYKFWPAVSRIDNPWGDRNLFCTCPAPTGT